MSNQGFQSRMAITPAAQGGPFWETIDKLIYVAADGSIIEVPSGFITDLESTPWWARGVMPVDSHRDQCAAAHDWLYTIKPYPRDRCDQLLKEMLLCIGVPEITAEEIYLAVREFGGSHW